MDFLTRDPLVDIVAGDDTRSHSCQRWAQRGSVVTALQAAFTSDPETTAAQCSGLTLVGPERAGKRQPASPPRALDRASTTTRTPDRQVDRGPRHGLG